MNNIIQDNRLLEALTHNSLYTYEFDVSVGLIEEEIINKSGVNFTEILGLEVPCSFDDMMERAFGDTLKCRYTSESSAVNLSRQALLDAFEKGKTKLESNIHYNTVERNQYLRITYLLSHNPENGHVLAYVICDDVTSLELLRGDYLHLDNTNLKRERDALTKEKNDLTEERDDLTRRNNNLTEERDDLTRRNNNLTEERDDLTRRNNNLTEERDDLTRRNNNLTEERDDLTRRNNNLTEERDDLTRRNNNLTEERDDLTRRNNNLTEERDDLTRRNNNLTEERDDLTRRNYNLTEERDSLTKENGDLTEERDVLNGENIELNRAADAVHSILNAGSFVCTYNLQGDIFLGIKYSEAMRKLYGYSSEKEFPYVWDSWLDCVVPEDRSYVENSYLNAVKDYTGRTLYDVTYRARQKDGTIRWQRAAAYVLRRADGSPITGYGLVMDIDEQKKAADKIDESLTQARLANAAKTSFLARMSHDIRTPMNGILGLIEINDAHAEEVEFTSRNRARAKVAANYLLSLLNDVLQLSKLEDPDVTLSCEAFNVRELAEDIYTIIKMRAVEYGITVEYDEDPDVFEYPYIWGSPLHVRQIFINILSNSIKYNKKGGKISSRVSVVKASEKQVIYKVVISDSGIGMSKEFLEHIFEPFSREHEDISSSYEGTGLGMSIVKRLIDKMEGTIEVESKVGEGSTFTVTLPFEIADASDIRTDDSELEQCDLSGVQILLVEDNDLNMEIAETFLKDVGAVVTKAFNGQQAVYTFSKAPAYKFDVILMDVMMPVMDGYEATRQIRSMDRPEAKTIPIIAMTANAFAEDVEESRNAGMNEHISKPLDIGKVKATIARYTNRRKTV
ncbi:ATP-binding protein [Jutongia sp.]